MRLISVYSVIVGFKLHCGVKKIGVVGLKRSKKDQRDNLINYNIHLISKSGHSEIVLDKLEKLENLYSPH